MLNDAITIIITVFLIIGLLVIVMWMVYKILTKTRNFVRNKRNKKVLKTVMINRYGKEKGHSVYKFFTKLGKT